MNDYVALRIDVARGCTVDLTDLLAAFLADAGYESFVPDRTGLTAYIPARLFSVEAAREAVDSIPFDADMELSHTLVEGEDWNEVWEKNYFSPIVVEGKCVIHATFHKDVPPAQYDIVIDPRMAFGTGHHFTTRLILGYLLAMPVEGKRVIDVGTGTGILAILAAMRGASTVDAIEIDPPAFENACCNVRLNDTAVNVILGDASALGPLEPADILIANINRNVITADIGSYAARLKPGGRMILSGFYRQDIPVLEAAAAPFGLHLASSHTDNEWAAIQLKF